MNAPAVFTSDAISGQAFSKKMLVGNAKILSTDGNIMLVMFGKMAFY